MKKLFVVLMLVAAAYLLFTLISTTRLSEQLQPTESNSTTGEPESGLKYTEKITKYNISGDSESALRSQMNTHTDNCYDTAPHDACTNWLLSWNVPRGAQGNSCELPVNVQLKVEFVYPEWVDANQSAPELVQHWNRYQLALQLHEEEHKNYALEESKKLAQFLSEQSKVNNCDELSTIANESANESIKRMREQDIKYDQQTDHGRTQGARFP